MGCPIPQEEGQEWAGRGIHAVLQAELSQKNPARAVLQERALPWQSLREKRGNEHLDSELSSVASAFQGLLLKIHTGNPECVQGWSRLRITPGCLWRPGMTLLPFQSHPTGSKGSWEPLEWCWSHREREKVLSNPMVPAERSERWTKDLWVRAETFPAWEWDPSMEMWFSLHCSALQDAEKAPSICSSKSKCSDSGKGFCAAFFSS